jgi:hypothetical protein
MLVVLAMVTEFTPAIDDTVNVDAVIPFVKTVEG